VQATLFFSFIWWTGAAYALPSRQALIIGNDSYPGNALSNARNDARAVAEQLRSLGYITTLLLDAGRSDLEHSVDTFAASLTPDDTAVVYYAGHGFQVDGENYLVPTDFHVTDQVDARIQGYRLSSLLEKLVSHGAGTQIIILDACRNNPFAGVRETSRGWARTATSAGAFLAFGTSPGSTASDNSSDGHGLFTNSLIHLMADPSLDIDQLFQKVRREVILNSQSRQVPWTASSLVGPFHMVPESDRQTKTSESVYEAPAPSTGVRIRSVVGDVSDNQSEYNPVIRDLLNEAVVDLRSFHLSDASSVLKAALSLDPRCALALRLLGIVLHLGGRDIEASEQFRAAVAVTPGDYAPYLCQCLIIAGHDISASRTSCEMALKLRPDLADAHIGLSINLFASGRLPEAYAEANKAVLLNPNDPEGYVLRGDIAAAEGQTTSAETDYKRAASLPLHIAR